jgi:hypothetical protein
MEEFANPNGRKLKLNSTETLVSCQDVSHSSLRSLLWMLSIPCRVAQPMNTSPTLEEWNHVNRAHRDPSPQKRALLFKTAPAWSASTWEQTVRVWKNHPGEHVLSYQQIPTSPHSANAGETKDLQRMSVASKTHHIAKPVTRDSFFLAAPAHASNVRSTESAMARTN